jgi:DNA-binding PadR family transcriptional regulator
MVESVISEPTPERGGRAKRIYRVTQKGLKALEEQRKIRRALEKGLSYSGGNVF